MSDIHFYRRDKKYLYENRLIIKIKKNLHFLGFFSRFFFSIAGRTSLLYFGMRRRLVSYIINEYIGQLSDRNLIMGSSYLENGRSNADSY